MRSLRSCRAMGVLVALAAGSALPGQQWQVFNMDNAGFPSDHITALAQDGQGILWVATDWGLVRYDGQDWTVIQQSPGGLPDNSLRSLAVDADDRLWIGTSVAGVAILDDGEWTYLNDSNSPIITEGVAGITHDHRGWAWINTELGLHCWTGTEWFLYNDQPDSHNGYQFFGSNVERVAVREDGLVTVATRNAGLTYISEDDFIYYTAASSNFPDNSANDVALDANGDRWLACPSGGLIWHAGPHVGGPWFQYNAFTAGFPNNTLNCIVVDADDRKIIGTETWGVLLFDGPGNWTSLDMQNSGLPDDDVRSLLIDDQQVLWVGTRLGGLARFDPTAGMIETGIASRELHVWPNPAADVLWMDLGELGHEVAWSLFDGTGCLVSEGRTQGGSLRSITLDGWASGTYLLRVASQGSLLHARVMVR